MAPKKRVPPAEDPETPCAVETPVPKRLSGTKKSPEQKQTELEALMLLSPRSKEKALARKAAYAAGALKSAETRKRKAAEAAAAAAAGTAAAVAPAAAAGAEVPGQETRSPVAAAAAAAAAPTPVSTLPGTPPPGGKARGSAGRGSGRGGAQGQGQGCRGQGAPMEPTRLAPEKSAQGCGRSISQDSFGSTLVLGGTATPHREQVESHWLSGSSGDEGEAAAAGAVASATATPASAARSSGDGGPAGSATDTPARDLGREFAELAGLAPERPAKKTKGARHPKEGTALLKQAQPRAQASFSADTASAEFANALAKAQDLILQKWPGLDLEEPLQITEDACGIAEPVTIQKFKIAMKNNGRFLGAHNFFAHNILNSVVTGVPVRQQAVDEYCRVTFKEPRHETRPITIAVPSVDWDPFTCLGSWQRLSPEEMPAALLQAVALDIQAGMPEDRLEKWNHILRSTVYEFVLCPSKEDQWWQAVQLREDITLTSFVVARTFLQRALEVQRFKARFLPTGSSASPTEVVNAYSKNLRQSEKANPEAAVTLNFVQNCDKIFRTMLADGRVASLLLEVDCAKGVHGPFNSHTKLAEICQATKADPEKTLWVLEGILYRMRQKIILGTPSIMDLRGSSARGSGLLHLLLMKLELKNQLFKRTLVELRMDNAFWTEIAAPKFASHVEFEEAYKSPSADLSWCSGLKKYEEELLNFIIETVFGTRYDSTIRQALKQGSGTSSGFMAAAQVKEKLASISTSRDEVEIPLTAGAEEAQDCDAPCAATALILTTVTVQTQGTTDTGPATSKTVALDSLDQESLDTVGSYHERVANLYRAHIHLCCADPENLRDALLATPAGKIQGGTGRFFNKYVVVLLDHKLLGEAASRPLQRLPAFSQTEVHRLYEAVRARFEEQAAAGEEPAAEQQKQQETLRGRRGSVSVGPLPEGDLYCVLDGGRDGGEGKPLFYFMGRMNKTVRKFTVFKTMASATSRMQRIRPTFGSTRLTERLHVVSKTAPKLSVTNFQHYPNLNSSGDCIGPVRLPKPDNMWTLPWPLKQKVLADAIQASGDRPDLAGEDAEEATLRASARANNSSEPVFFHALPTEFFEDLFRILQAAAVIDLTAGDGAAAVAAAKLRLLYFGLTLTDDHEQLLAARIKQQLINAMATEGDALYEPSLVAALLQERADEAAAGPGQDPAMAQPKAKAKAKGKAKAKAKSKAAARAPDLEGGDEGEEDQEGEEAELGDPFETEGLP